MALRVLLADESSTIKKVMQLALQDFGVEVKAVPIGLDVVQVSRSFKPDIIFADVLLSKRNGYEVSADVKADALLSKTPVVLMWSSFMEIDEAKVQESRADSKIEKPFDAETLRALVKELVHTTSSNLISNYLSFPDLPPIIDEQKAELAVAAKKSTTRQSENIGAGSNNNFPNPLSAPKAPAANSGISETKNLATKPMANEASSLSANSTTSDSKNHLEEEFPAFDLDVSSIDLDSELSISGVEAPEGLNFQLQTPEPEPQYEPIVIDDIEEPEEFQAVPLPRKHNEKLFEQLTSSSKRNTAVHNAADDEANYAQAADDLHDLTTTASALTKNSIPTNPKSSTSTAIKKTNDDWSHQDLSKFRIDLPMDEQFDLGEADLTNTSIALSSGVEEISLDEIENPRAVAKQQTHQQNKAARSSSAAINNNQQMDSQQAMKILDPMRAEELIRQEVRSVLEAIAWKVIPEIAERVVREEIQKLMKDVEQI